MRLSILLLALCACDDGFLIDEVDSSAVDVGESDVATTDAGEADVSAVDAGEGDDAATDAALGDATAPPDAMQDVPTRPASDVRFLAHQFRLRDGVYEMNVLTAVLAGAPVSTSPGNIFLRFDGGAEVTGMTFEGPAANAKCSDTLHVTDARGLLCRVSFPASSGLGAPIEVTLVADGTRYSAPVATCSASAPIGRCDEELLCVGGDCLAACTPETPDGWCFLQEHCDAGECVASCSVFSPDGYCGSGVCVDGECE